MRKALYCILMLASLVAADLNAFEDKTIHPTITLQSLEDVKDTINPYLKGILNLRGGLDTVLQGRKVTAWLQSGSTLEDDAVCRPSNHFHNPRNDLAWTASGLTDQNWFLSRYCSETTYPPQFIKSNIYWATGYQEPAPDGYRLMSTPNEWDWNRAREALYVYLTGKKYQGNVVAITETEREIWLTKSLRGLGQVLHLIQDMAVQWR